MIETKPQIVDRLHTCYTRLNDKNYDPDMKEWELMVKWILKGKLRQKDFK